MKKILILSVVLCALSARGADDSGNSSQGGKTLKADVPALKPIADIPGLPRVLLIGDSISIGYTIPVRTNLAGVANVHRPPVNCGDTSAGLTQLAAWLGDGKWDVIHFNWGLHDLKYMPTGLQKDPPADYEQHLRALVAQLKATGATLIWATTTPVAADDKGALPRHPADVVTYNDIAAKVMKDNGIRTDDLYALVLPQEAKIQLPQNVHYKPEGWQVLGRQVADSIKEALKEPAAKAAQ